MKLQYTPKAREDLHAIKHYIAVDLCNPSAADSVIERILRSCSKLKEQPNMGIFLSQKINRKTDLQYIITGKYLVFYQVTKQYVSIIRILDGRTNYIKIVLDLEM